MFAIPSGDGDAKGLQRFVVLFFVELATRPIEIGGISAVANGLWMTQIARNLADSGNGLPAGKRYLIHDGGPAVDGQFPADTDRCRRRTLTLPALSPNLNAYAERFVRSIKGTVWNGGSCLGNARCGQPFKIPWLTLMASDGTSSQRRHASREHPGMLNYHHHVAA